MKSASLTSSFTPAHLPIRSTPKLTVAPVSRADRSTMFSRLFSLSLLFVLSLSTSGTDLVRFIFHDFSLSYPYLTALRRLQKCRFNCHDQLKCDSGETQVTQDTDRRKTVCSQVQHSVFVGKCMTSSLCCPDVRTISSALRLPLSVTEHTVFNTA